MSRSYSPKNQQGEIHMVRIRIVLLALSALLIYGLAYSGEKRERCEKCRMYLDFYEKWAAEIQLEKGKPAGFCCSKCLFYYYLDMDKEQRKNIKTIRVSRYKNGKKLDAMEAFYAVGTDVMGPMGKALLPFAERSEAESFVKKHGGKVVLFKMIDKDLMEKFLRDISQNPSSPDS